MKDGPTVADYTIIDAKLIELGPDLVLFGYLVQWVRIKNGHPQDAEQMYISSIWRQINTRWKNIFSQDTPVAGKYTD